MVDQLIKRHKLILESQKYDSIPVEQVSNMAIIIENQNEAVRQLIKENSTSGDVAPFIPILVPIVRRIYPKLIANEICGVQAMTTPQGSLFAMTARYTGENDTSISPTNKGQIIVVEDASSINVNDEESGKGTVKYKEGNKLLVELDNISQKFAVGETFKGQNITQVYSNEAHYLKIFENYTGPMATEVGEAEAEKMKSLGLVVEKVDAKAKTRNIKGNYTIEMMNDLKAMHGANAESEIMDILGKEIQLEIDREVVNKVNSSATPLSDINLAGVGGRWDFEKLRVLSLHIANEAREVGRLSRRGSANVLLVSPKVATALEQIGDFVLAPSKGNIDAAGSGLNPVLGKFDNKYKVIVDNFTDNEYFTAIYKGSDKDAGVFFAPYIGLTFVKVVDPSSGQPGIILKTRYDIVNNPLTPEAYMRSAVVNFGTII